MNWIKFDKGNIPVKDNETFIVWHVPDKDWYTVWYMEHSSITYYEVIDGDKIYLRDISHYCIPEAPSEEEL